MSAVFGAAAVAKQPSSGQQIRRSEDEPCSASLQSVSETPTPTRERSPHGTAGRGGCKKQARPLLPLPGWLLRLRDWVWAQLEDLFEEFSPWLKWLVFDSILFLIVRFLSNRSARLEALFEALGWL